MTDVKQAARDVEDSRAADWGARAGLVARGVLWLVVGLLAAGVAAGGHQQADRRGALQALKHEPLGTAVLLALAVAFAAHAAFRVLEGTVGRRDEQDRRRRLLKRLWSLGRAVAYLFLAGSTALFLATGRSGGSASAPTARLMALPAGRLLVGVVGAGVVVGGLAVAVAGLREDFTADLALPRGWRGTGVRALGTAGLVGRGLVYALVGWFLVRAAVTFDPRKAEGLDQGLRALAHEPFGTALLAVAVASLLSFAAWSFAEACCRQS